MDPLTLGLTLTILGMGGTLFTLYVMSLIADILKRLFPIAIEPKPADPVSPPPEPKASPPATS